MKAVAFNLSIFGFLIPQGLFAEEQIVDEPIIVSVQELATNPDKYDQKRVSVYGWVKFGSHGYRAIEVRAKDWKTYCVDLAIPISIWEDRQERNRLNGRKQHVTGTFKARNLPEGVELISWHCGDYQLHLESYS